MYLHLGNEKIIPLRDVIAIINLPQKEKTDEIIKKYAGEGKIFEEVCQGMVAKSVILTKNKIFLSCISPYTLLKRAKSNVFLL